MAYIVKIRNTGKELLVALPRAVVRQLRLREAAHLVIETTPRDVLVIRRLEDTLARARKLRANRGLFDPRSGPPAT